MNPIKVILAVGLAYLAVKNGKIYFNCKEDIGKETNNAAKATLRKARGNFISSLIFAVIYAIISFA